MRITNKISSIIILFSMLMAASPAVFAGELNVQAYDNNGDTTTTHVMPVLGGRATQQPTYPQPQSGTATAYGYQDKPRQGASAVEEYRGYNGRTLEQAFYRCKYESFRAAPPGEQAKGLTERFRIRMSVMDVCMNSEGFFRNKTSFGGLDTNLMTVRDIF
jgi:hypothetical protein